MKENKKENLKESMKENMKKYMKKYMEETLNEEINEEINYTIEIEYRKRKSLEIQIKPDGRVRVLAPEHASRAWVDEAIASKRDWINQKLNQMNQVSRKVSRLRSGEKILDAGMWVDLHIGAVGGTMPVERHGGVLHVQVIEAWKDDRHKVAHLLRDWYYANTKNKVMEYLNVWSDKLGVHPKVVKIKDQKKRWGSCSSRGNLNFNWRLSMAPDVVLEYVVVHELCHFHHMDHSASFWNLVETCLPDYKEKRKWLKENGQYLFWLDTI